MTNFEKIKNMNINEIAEKISRMIGTCAQCQIESFCSEVSKEVEFGEKTFCLRMWEQWLEHEVENND